MAYNAFALKALLKKEHIIDLLEALGAHGINPRDPNGIRCSCPIHQSSGSTVFTYNPFKQLYICYGECNEKDKEGDIVSLIQRVQKCSFDSAVEYACEILEWDIKLFEDSEDWILDELKAKIEGILAQDNLIIEEELEFPYGVKPIDEESFSKVVGKKDELGFINNQGFTDTTLTLFESSYDSKDKRWLLPQRSPDGQLLGFDGRDVTNTKKEKWKKRAGLLKNKLLGRLDIVQEHIELENKIVIGEGKKDQMALFEVGLKHSTCVYGSSLSKEQADLISEMVSDEIIIAADGDKAGYGLVQSIVKSCYPEYNITVLEFEDGYDPADYSSKHLISLYENRVPVELWLKKYEYRVKEKK
jgi:DNA primase